MNQINFKPKLIKSFFSFLKKKILGILSLLICVEEIENFKISENTFKLYTRKMHSIYY